MLPTISIEKFPFILVISPKLSSILNLLISEKNTPQYFINKPSYCISDVKIFPRVSESQSNHPDSQGKTRRKKKNQHSRSVTK